MIFEIVSTALFGGISLAAYLKKGEAKNDSGKIQRIFTLSGLNVKHQNKTYTTQLVRKITHDWGTEYKYRIPLGKSFDDYQSKKRVLEDGLNNRRQLITLKDLRELRIDENIINNIKDLWTKKLTQKKEIELSYDGLLIISVYNEPLPCLVEFHETKDWKMLVGVTREKNTYRYHDFEKIPHFVLGGATRYGKSNFINSLIVSLIKSKPEHVNLFLIDLKGGVELSDYQNIKQTVSIAYEPEEALETLKMAYNKMKAIQRTLRALGKKSVQEAGIKERYFIIIDEVGELNPSESVTPEEKKIKVDCQTYMSQIARLGAGLGFRQILATQYGTGDIIPRQCKQNSDAKLCFRVQSGTASRVVLDGDGAEELPMIVGRAIYQTADKREIVQTSLMTPKIIKQTIEPYFKEEEIILEKEETESERGTNFVSFEEV